MGYYKKNVLITGLVTTRRDGVLGNRTAVGKKIESISYPCLYQGEPHCRQVNCEGKIVVEGLGAECGYIDGENIYTIQDIKSIKRSKSLNV